MLWIFSLTTLCLLSQGQSLARSSWLIAITSGGHTMLSNHNQKDAGITQDEVLDVLKRAGRPNFNKRLLTRFSSRTVGLLPTLRRTSRPGSNTPVYVWNEEVIEQIVALYDFMERGQRDYHNRLLYLWLRGYEVPFEPILKLWLQPAEAALHAITDGAEDADDMLWRVSTFIFEHWLPTWRFSPQPDPTIRQMGIDTYQILVEFMLSAFLVPNYEPDESLLTPTLSIPQKVGETTEIHQRDHTDTPPPTPSEDAWAWLRTFQEIFSLAQLREALLQVTGEEWAQAREDYRTLCQWLHTVTEVLNSVESLNLLSDPDMQVFRDRLFLLGGFTLVPLVLSARYYGYSCWIDQGITWVNEKLADLSDPEVREQLSQQLADYNLRQHEQKQARQ